MLFATSLLDNEVFKQKLIAKAAAEPFFFIQVLDKIAPQEDAINLSLTIKFCFPSLLESLAINDWPKVSEVVFSLLLSDDQENALEHKVKAMLEKGGEEVKALITKNFLKAIPNKQLELLCFTNNSFCKEVVEMLPKHIKTRLSRHQFEAFLTPNFLAALGNNRPLEKLFFSDVRFCNAVVEKMKDHTFTGPQISTMIKASKACKELEKILLEIPLRRLSKDAHTKFEHAVQTPQTVDSGVTRLIDVQKAVSLTSRLSVSAATYTESEAQTTPSLTEGLPTAASARAVTAALTVAPHSSPKPAKRPINPLAALLKEAQKSGEAPQPHREQPSTAQEHTALPDSANKTEVTASKQSTEADSKEQPQPAKNFAAELLKMFSQANRGLKDASLRVTPQTPAAQTATAAAQDQAPTPKQRPHKELFEKTSQANGLKAASLRDKPQTPATTEQQATSLQPATTAEDQTSTSQSQAISANASLGLLANLLIKTVPQQLTGRKELVPLEQNYLYLSSQAKAPTADLPKIKEEANKILKRINSALLELSLKGRRKACSESDAESDSENDWNDSDPKVEQQKLPPFTQQIDELQEKLKALIKEIDARIAATDSQSMPNIASPTAPRP
ncbi:MAG: hypothetical protein K0S08_1002 [Gammaproteobacteria bacterium]|nr:hypothetical protein [Gammaproteobacteria bacterium]